MFVKSNLHLWGVLAQMGTVKKVDVPKGRGEWRKSGEGDIRSHLKLGPRRGVFRTLLAAAAATKVGSG